MDPEVKKKVMIAVIVACLAAAIIMTVISLNRRAVAPGPGGPVQMLCRNPDCGKDFVLSRKEFNRIKEQARGGDLQTADGIPTRKDVTFTCPHCGRESGAVAMKCPQCEKIFIGGASFAQRFPDKCPSCGYSEMEQRSR